MLDPRCLYSWIMSRARSLDKGWPACSAYLYFIFDLVPDHGVEDLAANIV